MILLCVIVILLSQREKVISYIVLNRICKICDAGHLSESHDCRLNFVGSAKAMEPKAAIMLTKNSRSLTGSNLQVGIIIADNDSSSISAATSNSSHEVIKQADKNMCRGSGVPALERADCDCRSCFERCHGSWANRSEYHRSLA